MPRYLDHLLKLRQLRIVNALWQHGSISRASQALGLSQPALTKALQKIEETVGVQIFERHARGVSPTEAGHSIIETSRRVLAELTRLDEELDRIESSSLGSIAIGALPSAAIGLLPGTLALLQAQNTRLQIRILEGPFEELGPALASGEIDLIVGRLYEPPAPDAIIRQEMYEDPVVVLARAGHQIFAGEPCVSEIAKYELVVPPVGRRFGQELDQLVLNLPEFRPSLIRSTSIGFTRELMLASNVLTLAPSLMMIGDIRRGDIRVVPLDLPGVSRRPSGVTYRGDRPLLPAAQRFIAALKRTVADILPISPRAGAG